MVLLEVAGGEALSLQLVKDPEPKSIRRFP